MPHHDRASTGVPDLDRLILGLRFGDNVNWYDDAGSLAWVFCQNFIRAAAEIGQPLVLVAFDRSPKTLIAKLPPMRGRDNLIILDCFTWGKGAGSEVFSDFYQEDLPAGVQVIPVEEPQDPDQCARALWELQVSLKGQAHYIFESLTGMQEVWGGEEAVFRFYSRTAPRLFELQALAYWILERRAHSARLRAQINQVAQVVIELAIKRGSTSLTLVKSEGRDPESLHKSQSYWSRDLTVHIEKQRRTAGPLELGAKLKDLRTKKGLSQSELARLVGVTASNISQVESNLIYPSLPALVRIAEVLKVDVSYFFATSPGERGALVFRPEQGVEVNLPEAPAGSLTARLLLPMDFSADAEPYLLTLAPGKRVPTHFFAHKGEEMGYLLEGTLQVKFRDSIQELAPGDTIYLTNDMPSEWVNPGEKPAKLLWVKIN